MTILQLYLVFAKFGILCFGGGYMLVPLLTAELVGPGKPLAPKEFSSLVSIAQATPGPIGINTATYVGFTQHGVTGSILATAGIITPALILVILAIKLLKRYEQSLPVQGFLAGMKPASFGLILSAAVIFAELSVFSADIPWHGIWQWLTGATVDFHGFHLRISALLIAAATTVIMLKTRISFMYLLLVSAILGAFLCR
ncbi:chromate transporter [Victivallis vadensis]|uniref:chromate transporter n=1 Tax=Victivallis vadensis TaxID=172901 RepID=UPI00266C91C5|nr:chromate transporter [Victivallis vadensis]